MKKIFLPIIFLCLISIIFSPLLVKAQIVSCDGPDCTLDKLGETIYNIYSFLVNDIAGPLAILALTIGAIMMMISAGNPNLFSTGKKIFWSAVIGLVLVYGSLAIINFLLDAVGYQTSTS